MPSSIDKHELKVIKYLNPTDKKVIECYNLYHSKTAMKMQVAHTSVSSMFMKGHSSINYRKFNKKGAGRGTFSFRKLQEE